MFADLPAGTFAVRFTDGDEKKLTWLRASPPNCGDDTQDSDGIATYSDDHATLQQTVILGIELPKAEDMSATLYQSKHHDSGFYEMYELPETGGIGVAGFHILGSILILGAAVLFVTRKRIRTRG